MKKWLIYSLFASSVLFLGYCSRQPAADITLNNYLNLDEEVAYVGMDKCRSCHPNVYESYQHTGMGKSFAPATPKKSAATFGKHAIVYDEATNLYYKPFFKDSTLFIKEFRLTGKDTTHIRTEEVAYIVGSGQHTNSHILEINGYLYQAPITYYTQDQKWDLAPGFENGENARFNRVLTTECLTCHNHYPQHVEGSLNKYSKMPSGIECERCHGPGEIHVKEKLEGKIIDTLNHIDYTIVNPANLPRNLQMDLCQRCHLQGVAVLNENKTFFDFKPGMPLSDVMNVFLPRYSNSDERFIMASQADRLRLSKCYLLSEDLSCLTCHHPHHSIEKTNKEKYNNACLSCHQSDNSSKCTAPIALIEKEENNCVSCHMRRSGSIDIPHVNITDHYIARETASLSSTSETSKINENQKSAIATFLGLELLTKEKGTPLEMANGYIALYEKFIESEMMLDSAFSFLSLCKEKAYEVDKAWIHYYFAKKDFTSLQKFHQLLTPEKVVDGWTAYRLGEAAYLLQSFNLAAAYYKKAVEFMPFHLDFSEKLGNTFLQLNMSSEAIKVYQDILSENPKREAALCNMGYAYALQGKFEQAELYYDKAVALDPDYEQALLNKGALAMAKGNKQESILLFQRVLEINPANEKVRQLLKEMQ